MFAADDVVDLMWEAGVFFVNQAVFAPSIGALCHRET